MPYSVQKDWVGDEPFLLLLGDHVYASDIRNFLRQSTARGLPACW